MDLAVSETRLGGTRIFTGIVRDISERKGAEDTRAKLAAIVESSHEAIIGKTLDGIIATWNGGAERLFGYRAAEVIGRPISLLIPPEREHEETQILERLRRGEQINQFETVRVTRDGRKIDVSLTVSPIRNSTGNIVGASKIVQDITAKAGRSGSGSAGGGVGQIKPGTGAVCLCGLPRPAGADADGPQFRPIAAT